MELHHFTNAKQTVTVIRYLITSSIHAQLFDKLQPLASQRFDDALTLLGFSGNLDTCKQLDIFLSMLVRYIGTHSQTAQL